MKHYDVVISGSGIYGAMLGTILAKNNVTVKIIEEGRHPRFSLGEAMLPQSALWAYIIGEYFQIPEIQNLSDSDRICEHITKNCGIKHSIGFAYHEENCELEGSKLHQLIPPNMPFYSESHLVRSDIDHYLLKTALSYGCEYLDETKIIDVEIEEKKVIITTESEEIHGSLYVDSTGKNSLLARKLNLRETADDLKTKSRCIFNHVENLKPFDEVIPMQIHPGQSKKLHHGTLHHVFYGGWMWVIPFDNFEKSSSKIGSIGILLDETVHPEQTNLSAEEEFKYFVNKFPTVKEHLKGIDSKNNFTRTKRLQYSASKSVGDRFILTNNTFGFVDALYSNGLINCFESIFSFSNIILEAKDRDGGLNNRENVSETALKSIDLLHKRQLKQADTLVSNAYKAMKSFDTWNAWTQFWLVQALFHDLWIQRSCFKFFDNGNKGEFKGFLNEERPGMKAPFYSDVQTMLGEITDTLNDFSQDNLSSLHAAEKILNSLSCQDWLPMHSYQWGNKDSRHVDFSLEKNAKKLLGWGFDDSPDHIKNGLFDFKLPA